MEAIADAIPQDIPKLIKEVTDYSINLMPINDQKLLPAPKAEISKTIIGKKTLAALKRVGWRTFCDPESEVHSLWSKSIPKVFNRGCFAVAVTTTFADWRIGIPHLAAGLAATAMKFTCKEFCETFKPEGLMIPQNEKSRG